MRERDAVCEYIINYIHLLVGKYESAACGDCRLTPTPLVTLSLSLCQVRLSLQETVGDLENKDLQLALAMQDLSIATDEIRKVAGLRATLETMER